MDLAPDFNEFCALLSARSVEFVIVGAHALAFHGAPRFTGDLDIVVRPTEENGRRRTTGRLHALLGVLPVRIAAYSNGSNGMRTKLALPVRDPTTAPCRSTTSTIAVALALLRSSASVSSRRSLL